jgi:peptidoglycan/LPS O-acetylase OafA/YrhL
MLTHMFVNNLLGTLIFVTFSSPPLLSLFLLRRPSFWRVLLHVATAFYILWIIYIHTFTTPPNLLWKYVAFTFLLVYSGGALVAGLPEAAAGKWARWVYYTALLLWLFLAVELLL